MRDAHLRFFADFVHDACVGLQGPDEMSWDHRLIADWDNVHAAFHWALESGRADDASAIVIDLVLQGLLRQPEILLWTDDAYRRFGHVPHVQRHQLAGAAAYAAWARNDPACVERAELAAELAADADTGPYYRPEWGQTAVGQYLGTSDEVVELCRTTAQRAQDAGLTWDAVFWWTNVAISLMMAGRGTDAIAPARQAVTMTEHVETPPPTRGRCSVRAAPC
jgi:hypothetical protein